MARSFTRLVAAGSLLLLLQSCGPIDVPRLVTFRGKTYPATRVSVPRARLGSPIQVDYRLPYEVRSRTIDGLSADEAIALNFIQEDQMAPAEKGCRGWRAAIAQDVGTDEWTRIEDNLASMAPSAPTTSP